MAKVTTDPATGDVVIRCSLEEAMAVELVLAFSDREDAIEHRIFSVWDKLDDLRHAVMQQHPTDIPLELRHIRGGG